MIPQAYRNAILNTPPAGGDLAPSVVVQSVTALMVPEIVDTPVAGPTMEATSGVVAAATGTTRTATIPGFVYEAGDVLWVQVATRMVGTVTVTPPAGHGFSVDESESVSNRSDWHFYKRWGTGGTDNPSMVFTCSTGGVWILALAVLRGCKPTGAPYSQKLWMSNAANLTMVAGPVANPVGTGTRTGWFYGSGNDNNHGDQTRGTLGYAGQETAGNGSAISFVHEENVNSGIVSCSMMQVGVGPNTYRSLCVVFTGP